MLNPKELGMNQEDVERRTGLKIADITAALASYVRTIRSGDSRFDRYADGNQHALNDVEKAGLTVFRGKARCTTFHAGRTSRTRAFTIRESHGEMAR